MSESLTVSDTLEQVDNQRGLPFVLENGFQVQLKPTVMYRFVRLFERVAVAECLEQKYERDEYKHINVRNFITLTFKEKLPEEDPAPENPYLDAGYVMLTKEGRLRVFGTSGSLDRRFRAYSEVTRCVTLNRLCDLLGIEYGLSAAEQSSDVTVTLPQ
jgi:hypothetical protein